MWTPEMMHLLEMEPDPGLVKNAIPEFVRHNIIEGNVRDVC